jgi:hypothetical protein
VRGREREGEGEGEGEGTVTCPGMAWKRWNYEEQVRQLRLRIIAKRVKHARIKQTVFAERDPKVLLLNYQFS